MHKQHLQSQQVLCLTVVHTTAYTHGVLERRSVALAEKQRNCQHEANNKKKTHYYCTKHHDVRAQDCVLETICAVLVQYRY